VASPGPRRLDPDGPPRGLTLVPMALVAVAFVVFVLGTLVGVDGLLGVSVVLGVLAAVSFVLVPFVVMTRTDRRR
jgi:hypothetical protein